MRVTTAFNRILALDGATVASIRFEAGAIVAVLRRRSKRLVCPCGANGKGRYDQRLRRWRHIDLGGTKFMLEAPVRRLACRSCDKIRTEVVPWARPGARHTRDFERLATWLAARMDKTSVARLLRCSWEAIDRMVLRVVEERLDPTRLQGLRRIGVDEVNFRYRRFLTLVVDHDGGGVVWVAEGRNAQALKGFFDALGPAAANIEAVSMDLGQAYRSATTSGAPNAAICLDPFHVIQHANKAVRACVRSASIGGTLRGRGRIALALMKDPASMNADEVDAITQLRRERSAVFRAWVLKEDLRLIYRLPDPTDARTYLRRWCTRAIRSKIPPMIALGRSLRSHAEGIIAAIELGLSNARLEGTASKVRLINHRGYGHHSIRSLGAMIYLCCGAVTLASPWG